MEKLTNTQNRLLKILGSALFLGRFDEELCPSDWDSILEEAKKQAVFSIVFSKISERIHLGDYWNRINNIILRNNISIEYEHFELNSLFKKVPYVILKGVASASYYNTPLLRELGDVDFLVKKEDLTKASRILELSGFSLNENPEHEAHIVYHRSPSSVWELHWTLSMIPENEAGERIKHYLDDIIETSVFYKNGEDCCRIPDYFHHGIVLLVHTAGHMVNTGIGLRHLCDWGVFVNSIDDFEKLFCKPLKECGLWRFAQILTQLCTVYLGLPSQKWAMDISDSYLLESLIEDIFHSGNFGVKNSNRINQAKLFTDNKGSIAEDSMIIYLFKAINNKAKLALPNINCFVLRPVAWLYVIVRHIFFIIIGKRNGINAVEMVEGAGNRRHIYKDLELFKVR